MSYQYQQSHYDVINDKFKTLYHLPKQDSEIFKYTFQRNNSPEHPKSKYENQLPNSNLANYGSQLLLPKQKNGVHFETDRSEPKSDSTLDKNELQFLPQADLKKQIRNFYELQNQAHELQSTEISQMSTQRSKISKNISFMNNTSMNNTKFKPKLTLKKHLVLHIDYLSKVWQSCGKLQISYKVIYERDLDLDLKLERNMVKTKYYDVNNPGEYLKIQFKKIFPQFSQLNKNVLRNNSDITMTMSKSRMNMTKFGQKNREQSPTSPQKNKKQEQCYLYLQVDLYDKVQLKDNQETFINSTMIQYGNTRYNNNALYQKQELEYLKTLVPMKSFFTVINIYNEEGNFNEGIYKLRTYDCGKFKIPDIIYSQIPEPHYEHPMSFMIKLTQEDKNQIDNYMLYSPFEYKVPILHDYKKRTFMQRQKNIDYMSNLQQKDQDYLNMVKQTNDQYSQELVESIINDIQKDVSTVNEILQQRKKEQTWNKKQQEKQSYLEQYEKEKQQQRQKQGYNIWDTPKSDSEKKYDFYNQYNIDKNYHLEYLKQKQEQMQQNQQKLQAYNFSLYGNGNLNNNAEEENPNLKDNLSTRSSKLEDYFNYQQQREQFQQQQGSYESIQEAPNENINDTNIQGLNTGKFPELASTQKNNKVEKLDLDSIRTPPAYPGKGFNYDDIKNSQKEFYQKQEQIEIAPYIVSKFDSKNDSFQVQGKSNIIPDSKQK